MKFTVKAISNPGSDSPATSNDSVLREWRESAVYWQKHIDTIRLMFAPVTQALIEDAGIGEGNSVLDVAGGSGEPSLTIADRVGPTGLVTMTDAVGKMINAAQSEARRRGITNIQFHQCPAESLPFQSRSFDAVVCRLGAMFFSDPVAALREMLRVTKSGGAKSLAVWSKSELNPFFYVITNVVERHLESQPAGPGAFRFAEAGALAQLLREAGGKNIRERVLNFQIAAPVSPKGFWEMRAETSGTLREKLATTTQEQRDLIAQEVQAAVSEFFPNNQMSFPAQMIVITGAT